MASVDIRDIWKDFWKHVDVWSPERPEWAVAITYLKVVEEEGQGVLGLNALGNRQRRELIERTEWEHRKSSTWREDNTGVMGSEREYTGIRGKRSTSNQTTITNRNVHRYGESWCTWTTYRRVQFIDPFNKTIDCTTLQPIETQSSQIRIWFDFNRKR